MASVPVYATGGRVACYTTVDDRDAGDVSQHLWYLSQGGSAAVRAEHYKLANGSWTSKRVYLSRQILGLQGGDPRWAAHRDGNGWDNTRANLVAVEQRVARGEMRRRKPVTPIDWPAQPDDKGDA